jgi:hypothetical protein
MAKKKVSKTPLLPINWTWWYMLSCQLLKSIGMKMVVQVGPIQKIIKAKNGWG